MSGSDPAICVRIGNRRYTPVNALRCISRAIVAEEDSSGLVEWINGLQQEAEFLFEALGQCVRQAAEARQAINNTTDAYSRLNVDAANAGEEGRIRRI